MEEASWDNTVKLWGTQDGRLLRTLQGHIRGINSVAYSPDGKTLASASSDNTVKLWGTQDGKLLRTLEGHSCWVYSVAYSPDRNTLASASLDKTVKLWGTQDGQLLRTLEGHTDSVLSVAYSPDGKTLASASSDKTVWLFELEIKVDVKVRVRWVASSYPVVILNGANFGHVEGLRKDQSQFIKEQGGIID
ncbi:MAG: WD40 repeat domain-containing protein [Myxococcota bacterium]